MLFFLGQTEIAFFSFWSISFFFYSLLNDRGCLWDFKFAGDCFSLRDDNRLNFGFSGIYVVLVVSLRFWGLFFLVVNVQILGFLFSLYLVGRSLAN